MPLLNQKSDNHHYSKPAEVCAPDNENNSDDHFTLDDLVVGEECTDDEIIAALDDKPVAGVSKNVPVSAPSKNVPAPESPSKNVPAAVSKNVPRRGKRADDKIIEKIRNFRVEPHAPHLSSLVGSQHPSITHPVSASITHPVSTPIATPTPANDNLIPVWSKTSDNVKVFSACVALQTAETSPVAFTFNLPPETIAGALSHPEGFLDALKRSLDKELKRALGYVFPYVFAIDIDERQRLHIHGAFTLPVVSLWTLRQARNAMRKAWGDWQGEGRRKQVRFATLYDDGWASYIMRNQKRVARIIGKRTFTINQPLRREAEATYTIIRSIMRRKRMDTE